MKYKIRVYKLKEVEYSDIELNLEEEKSKNIDTNEMAFDVESKAVEKAIKENKWKKIERRQLGYQIEIVDINI
ncbi:MAG: hypothetical protein ACFFG0_06240 [Candidatus Thorarchaeota archaeon]